MRVIQAAEGFRPQDLVLRPNHHRAAGKRVVLNTSLQDGRRFREIRRARSPAGNDAADQTNNAEQPPGLSCSRISTHAHIQFHQSCPPLGTQTPKPTTEEKMPGLPRGSQFMICFVSAVWRGRLPKSTTNLVAHCVTIRSVICDRKTSVLPGGARPSRPSSGQCPRRFGLARGHRHRRFRSSRRNRAGNPKTPHQP